MSWTKSTELIKIEANLLRNISVGNSFASNSHNKPYRYLESDNMHFQSMQQIPFLIHLPSSIKGFRSNIDWADH
jgi:hypothetical protein